MLRWSAIRAPPAIAAAVEAAAIAGELLAVGQSTPTPGAAEILQSCHAVGRPIVIVSNNATEAIDAFLTRALFSEVHHIVGRVPGRPELMKPNPDSLRRPIHALDVEPTVCALVGDSVTDVEACIALGVQAVGYAKNPRRGQELALAGALAITDSMNELAQAIRDASVPAESGST